MYLECKGEWSRNKCASAAACAGPAVGGIGEVGAERSGRREPQPSPTLTLAQSLDTHAHAGLHEMVRWYRAGKWYEKACAYVNGDRSLASFGSKDSKDSSGSLGKGEGNRKSGGSVKKMSGTSPVNKAVNNTVAKVAKGKDKASKSSKAKGRMTVG